MQITSESVFKKLYKDRVSVLNGELTLNLIKSKITNINSLLADYINKYGNDYRSFDADGKKLVNDSFMLYTKINKFLSTSYLSASYETKQNTIAEILGEEKTKLLKKIDLKEKK